MKGTAADTQTCKQQEPGLLAKCIGDAAVLYTKGTTDRLTDLAGTFLVMCISIYFTVGGYLLYRELALSS
jgi:hypothetical protein